VISISVTISISSEVEELATRVKILGNYSSLEEAIEDAINDYYKYIVEKYIGSNEDE